MDTITILQWLIPSGALGTILGWVVNRTLRNLRTTKEVHDTYKQLYEDIRETLIELQNENQKLYKSVLRLEKIISRAPSCKYYATCPIGNELQYYQANISNSKQRNKGQYYNKGNTESNTCDNSTGEGEYGDTDSKPP